MRQQPLQWGVLRQGDQVISNDVCSCFYLPIMCDQGAWCLQHNARFILVTWGLAPYANADVVLMMTYYSIMHTVCMGINFSMMPWR
jgi:hypothetical protein